MSQFLLQLHFVWLVSILSPTEAIKLKKTPGIQYGQDCSPLYSMDHRILLKVARIPKYQETFGPVSIYLLRPEEWTVEMEDAYVEGLLGDESRCSLMEGLKCELEMNQNTPDLNFHHHHPSEDKGPQHESTPPTPSSFFEPRSANVEEESNLVDFDLISELDPEWRCLCNSATSVHLSLRAEDPSDPIPFFHDICLIKVGFPCKYKGLKGGGPPVAAFKAEYHCIPDAECLPVTLPGQSNPLEIHNHDVATTLPPPGNGSMSPLTEIQAGLKEMNGYQLDLNGVRPAYLNYVLRHMTHVCKCTLGYEPDGNGLCIRSPRGGWEARAAEKPNNRSSLGLDHSDCLKFLVIIIIYRMYKNM